MDCVVVAARAGEECSLLPPKSACFPSSQSVSTDGLSVGSPPLPPGPPPNRGKRALVTAEGGRSVDSFTKLEQVGQGTFGSVWKAVDRESGQVVALKRIRMENEREGFPITALREMKILSKMAHENIVLLKEIVASRLSSDTLNKGSVFMVFEYCPLDLTGLMEAKTVRLKECHVMCIMKQILTGLHYAHINGVLHRDIKLPNILISREGVVKIADWGLGRAVSDGGKYTNRVVTLWYRAPELLLGEVKYSSAIDLWSVGCLFAELMSGMPILPGKDEVSQLKMIFELCGHPTPATWPEWSSLPLAGVLALPPTSAEQPQLPVRFAWMRPTALAFLRRFLACNPTHRVSAMDALDDEYFWQDNPRPCLPWELPLPLEDAHEFELKERKRGRLA